MNGAAFDVPVSALVRRDGGRDRDGVRRARPRPYKGRTVALRSFTRTAIEVGRALFPEQPGVDYERPRTRGECAEGERPCPYVSCRFHLYLDVNRAGGLKLNFPDVEVGDMPETCALDVADRGGATLEALRPLFNLTRQGVQLLERVALGRLADALSEARLWPR